MDPSNDERMRREDELRRRVAEESLALPVGDSAAQRSEEGETQRRGDELRTRWTLHAVQTRPSDANLLGQSAPSWLLDLDKFDLPALR